MSPKSQHNGLAIPDSDQLKLHPDAQATYSYHDDKSYQAFVSRMRTKEPADQENAFVGPYHLRDAPYRAKLSLPHEPGGTLIIKGRLWSLDDKEPLHWARIEVWQTNSQGEYDKSANYINRARLHCDENGYYEFETVRPGAYEQDGQWRAPHIHFFVEAAGYVPVFTQLFFAGDEYHDEDEYIHDDNKYINDSLVIELRQKDRDGQEYEEGIFDIVLKREKEKTL